MANDKRERTIGEHLKSATLYDDPRSEVVENGWRSRLLADRFPIARSRHDSPQAGFTGIARLLLLIALPFALSIVLMILADTGTELLPNWSEVLQNFSFMQRLKFEFANTAEQLGAQRLLGAPLKLVAMFLIAGLSMILTFAIRGRTPRLLPLDL